jgi:hypothetical protein
VGFHCMFLVVLITGCAVQEEDLKQFGQWKSRTPGHPENFETPGVEVTRSPQVNCLFRQSSFNPPPSLLFSFILHTGFFGIQHLSVRSGNFLNIYMLVLGENLGLIVGSMMQQTALLSCDYDCHCKHRMKDVAKLVQYRHIAFGW